MAALLTFLGLLVSATLQVPQPTSAGAAAQPQIPSSMTIDPTEVGVGTFYSGTTVSVEGVIPAGYDAAIACVGRARPVELKKKGRVLGILWMNVGDVAFENVPSVYLLSTSRRLAELAPPPILQELQVGYQAIESMGTRSLENGDTHGTFGELLKLKESERLYSYNEGGVSLGPEEGGTVHVSAQCFLPARAPSGEYEIRLLGFREGRGELLHVARLHLTPVGATAFISSLAQRHGLLYGILAVVIALVVGLLTGFVFGLAAKTGH
jgi:uncharacterized protein (TIGR02186 family)